MAAKSIGVTEQTSYVWRKEHEVPKFIRPSALRHREGKQHAQESHVRSHAGRADPLRNHQGPEGSVAQYNEDNRYLGLTSDP